MQHPIHGNGAPASRSLRDLIIAGAAFVLLTSFIAPAGAMPPKPVRDDRGDGAAIDPGYAMLQEMDLLPGLEDGAGERMLPPTGTLNIPAILVQYQGRTGVQTVPAFNTALFTPTAGSNSMHDYFDEVSQGAVNVTGTTWGWFTLPRPEGWYVNGGGGMLNSFPMNSQGLVWDALTLADATINFAQYDNDSDGVVDNVIFVFSGYAAESYTPSLPQMRIWSHCFWLGGGNGPGPFVTNDGVTVDMYTIQSELSGTTGSTIRDIGVFCHELGHAFGLPDLWSTCPQVWLPFFGAHSGVGSYDLMGFGGWGAGGTNPTQPFNLSAWSKAFLGWANLIYVTVNVPNMPIPAVETTGTVVTNFPWWNSPGMDIGYSHPWATWPGPAEAFLVENRQAVGFDAALPGTGLLIYHFDGREAFADYDMDGLVNYHDNDLQWQETHLFLDVECADQWAPDHQMNNDDLAAQNNLGDAGDFFRTGGNTAFNAGSTPSSMLYGGGPSLFAVDNITGTTGTIFADVSVGNPGGPSHDVWIKDCTRDDGTVPSSPNCDCMFYRRQYDSCDIWVDNDGDGIADQPQRGPLGTTNRLFVKVRNLGPRVSTGRPSRPTI